MTSMETGMNTPGNKPGEINTIRLPEGVIGRGKRAANGPKREFLSDTHI